MCRGLAAGYDTETHKMICTGEPSHTRTLGDREDHCVKLEIIISDKYKVGYYVTLDNDERQQPAGAKKYVTKSGEMTKALAEIVESWRKKNNAKILQYLLTCQTHAEREQNTDNSWRKSGRHTNNGSQTSGQDTDNSYQKSGRDTNNSYQISGGEWYCGKLKLTKYPGTTELVNTVRDRWDLTLPELLNWVVRNRYKAKQLLAKDKKRGSK